MAQTGRRAAPLSGALEWVRRRWVLLLAAVVLLRVLEACFPWQSYDLSFDPREFDFASQEPAVERCLDRSGVTHVSTESSFPPIYNLRAGLGEAEELASCLRPLGSGSQLRRS